MIDTQAIRSKILDLAMRGKLTEQHPEDGTAEELYRQIQARKQKLIKAGKIKKEKILPETVVEEEPYSIPATWKWVRLGSIGVTITGGTPSKSCPEYYGGDYPFFKPSDLDAGRHITKASEYLTEAGKEVAKQIQQGSILVCCIGSIGKAAIIDTDGTANQQINALTPLDSNNEYLLYSISNGAFQHQLDQGSRATTVSIINKSKFDNCVIPLPPLAEQRRIVERIDQTFSILDTIDSLQARYADNLTMLKSKLIDAAIQGKLTAQLQEDGTAEDLYRQIQVEKQALIKAGKIKKEKPLPEISADEIPFEIPSNWKWVRLGDYCQKVTDQVASGSFASLRENVKSLKTPDYAVMVKTADFSNGFTKNLTYTDKHGYEFLSNSNLFGGELILSNVGSVGKCFIVPKLPCKMTLAPNAVMVRMMEEAGKDYLYYFLISPQGFKELDAISTGVAVKKFNKTELKKILISLPPLAEQKRIVKRLQEVFRIMGV